MEFNNFAIVFLGGGFGAMMRYTCNLFFFERYNYWVTFGINMLGSFILGIVLIWTLNTSNLLVSHMRLFFITGFLGGFTTFGAFNMELVYLIQDKAFLQAFIYGFSTIISGPIMLFLGMIIAKI